LQFCIICTYTESCSVATRRHHCQVVGSIITRCCNNKDSLCRCFFDCIRNRILQEREVPGAAEPAAWTSKISDKELTKNIIVYLRLMADGDLDEAQKTAELIAPTGIRAVEILDRIAVSDMPEPELADIPKQVLAGLIRNLRTRIS